MQLSLNLALVLVIINSSLAENNCGRDKNGLILASESAGNGESKVYSQRRMEFLENVNGTFHYDGQKLNNISIYQNGTVEFNNGSVIMAVFMTNLTNSTNTNKNTHVIYDTNKTDTGYRERQKQYMECLLQNVSVNFTICHFFVVTWVSYGYCNRSEEITFQLALASDSFKTYAMFLYNGTNNSDCNPSVQTGFKAGTLHNQINIVLSTTKSSRSQTKLIFISDSGSNQSFYQMDAKSLLTTGNASMNGVFIYQIDATKSYLVPYTDDYFDMDVRTYTRRHQKRKYGIKHMIFPQPPFVDKTLMRLYIYKNGTVSFGKRLTNGQNDGQSMITATGNLSFKHAQMCYFVNPSFLWYSRRKEHIMELLKCNGTDDVEEFDLENMMVITWTNVYLTNCSQPIKFQIGLVSDGKSTTYALLINDLRDCTWGEIRYKINGGGKFEVNLGNNTQSSHPVNLIGNDAVAYKLT